MVGILVFVVVAAVLPSASLFRFLRNVAVVLAVAFLVAGYPDEALKLASAAVLMSVAVLARRAYLVAGRIPHRVA